jgi:glycosyltransferase involved in cell wall biosynthesis
LTGFVCDTVEQMMTAVCRLGELDRAECRAIAERRFSRQAIVDEYEQLYLRLHAS